MLFRRKYTNFFPNPPYERPHIRRLCGRDTSRPHPNGNLNTYVSIVCADAIYRVPTGDGTKRLGIASAPEW